MENIRDDKPQKPAYEVDYSTLSDLELREKQNDQVTEVTHILGLSAEQTAILLRFFKWQKERLIDKYMDAPEKVLEEAGLGPEWNEAPKLEKVRGFCCDICCDDDKGLQTYTMKCAHRYCAGCYTQYLESKIKMEGEAARIQCPRDGCSRIVDSKTVKLLVSPSVWER